MDIRTQVGQWLRRLVNVRITFVHSPSDCYDQNYGTQFTPLWAFYLAAYVPAGWDVQIVDTRIDDLGRCESSDVFAFSGINQDESCIQEAWKTLRRQHPDARFILGGPITWSFEQEGKLDRLAFFDHLFILDGEEALPAYLSLVESKRDDEADHVIRSRRYDFQEAVQPRIDLLDGRDTPYYGAIIEVSRGCPFLCEFCDIRVLPDNNQTHPKPVEVVIAELDAYYRRGVRQFQFACDNFIGNLSWARSCVEAIAAWRQRTGATISIFTWLTINLYKSPELMTQMREAGFTTLFIGIESVNRNSLLEMAKVQNLNALETAIEAIHGHGFIIAPGFIFGFDSDTDTVFDETLAFMQQTGTLGGDPSFLTALAGTPLFDRMRRTGRLVEEPGHAIERRKIATNIRYLQDTPFLVQGFTRFVSVYTSPRYQFERLRRHLELLNTSSAFVPSGNAGYASPWPYIKRQLATPAYRSMLFRRLRFIARPDRAITALRGWWMTRRAARTLGSLSERFYYWLYAWTNLALKYEGLSASDFDLHSVDANYDVAQIMTAPGHSATDVRTNKAQSRHTRQALAQVVQLRIDQPLQEQA